MSSIVIHNALCGTESKALLKSMKHMCNGYWCSCTFSINTRRYVIWSLVPLPMRNPASSSEISASVFFSFVPKQEMWPPGSADTVCPRPPLVTQVQHFVSDDVSLWPWPLTFKVTAIIGHTRQSTTYKFRFRSMVHRGQTYHVTLWPWSLTLEVMALAADAGLRPPSAHQLWSS